MKWSWKLGRLFGIDVFVHATFVLLLAWVALSAYVRTRAAHAMLMGVLFTLAVFGSVVLHELGHALTARRFGIRTRDITLLPIGGVARLERMPEKPGQELLVALAGPAVNLAIALVLFGALTLAGRPAPFGDVAPVEPGTFLARLLWLNVGLAVFNLVPAFPMDGGRALRALLALRGDYVAATQLSAKLGQAIAVVFGILGLLYNPVLAFIALFVWIGAGAEAAGVTRKAALRGLTTEALMQTELHILSTHDTLGEAARLLLSGAQVDFPVLGPDGRLAGMLTEERLIAGLAERGTERLVLEVMDRRCPTSQRHELLDVAFARLEDRGYRALPVVDDGRVVGLLTADKIGEAVMIRAALAASQAQPALRTLSREARSS